MKQEILNNLVNPKQLEKLYREHKAVFKKEFNALYPEIKDHASAQIWNERLNFGSEEISWGTQTEIIFVIITALLAGVISNLPNFFGFEPDYFYQRNISFIVFPFLTAWFAWKQNLPLRQLAVVGLVLIASVIFINLLPKNESSDTLILSCIHLPLFLWAVLGFTFTNYNLSNTTKRIEFLWYNGDFVVMTGLIFIAGGLLTGMTIGLFSLINIHIEEFYAENIITWGLAAVPIIGSFLVQTNPQLVNKIPPIIAKIFSPLVLVTLVIYLGAIFYTGKDPYNDRDFLLIFNILLMGVMAIILFAIAESSKNSATKIGTLILFGLSVATIVVNGIALSAIIFRISEWGITPNRLAVLGGNVLILTNLLIVSYQLFKTIQNRNEITKVENSIVSFLPVYVIWTIIVTFVFPFIFSFK